MARNRECMRVAADSAAPIPPPPVTIAREVNCAEPANTSPDVTMACGTVKPACTASTPNESDSTNPTAAYGRPSLSPGGTTRCSPRHG